MYCWELLSGDTSQGPFLLGVTGDLAEAMRLCEQHVREGRAFLAHIEAVRYAMSVHGMDCCYVRTGLYWVGRRTIHGRVRWEEHDIGPGAVLPSRPLPLPR
jgi:hypothetical protein